METRRLRLRTEGPLFLCKPPSRPSDSATRILPWTLCQGGCFLQPRMTMGGCSPGLTWGRLSEGHRGSREPGWKQKRIRTIEWLHARLGSSHPSPPRASLLASQPASAWLPSAGLARSAESHLCAACRLFGVRHAFHSYAGPRGREERTRGPFSFVRGPSPLPSQPEAGTPSASFLERADSRGQRRSRRTTGGCARARLFSPREAPDQPRAVLQGTRGHALADPPG